MVLPCQLAKNFDNLDKSLCLDAIFDWDNARLDGYTTFVETGLLYQEVQFTYKYALQDPDSTNDSTFGVHFFRDRKHEMRFGVEYRFGDSSDLALIGGQLAF